MKKILLILFCLSITAPVFAYTALNNNAEWWSPSRLSIGAYGGYGNVSGAYRQDGQFAQGRMAVGLRAADYKAVSFGAEAGVQSGNDMRLDADTNLINAAGGLPIQTTLKPLLDLLITVKAQILPCYPLFALLKGGVAYRQLVFVGRSSAEDGLRKLNPELQAGFAYSLTDHATVTAFYQGIYSGPTAGLAINSVGDVTMSHIPTQQAGFLGFEYVI